MRLKKHEVRPEDRYVLVTDKKYRMNTLLKRQLDIFINFVQYDSDMVILIDGKIEGVGKSTLGQQVGYYFAHETKTKFDVDNIVFSPEQFKRAVLNAPKFSCIVWDEAYEGTNKFQQMTKDYQTLSTIIKKIRQNNLFIIIIMPSFFDLSIYYAVYRSWCLINCYLETQISSEDIEAGKTLDFSKPVLYKGFFRFYTRSEKEKIHRKKSFIAGRSSFAGQFPAYYTVDEQEYKDKKAKIEDEPEFDEREFLEECIRRGMEVPYLQNYSQFSRQYLYEIRSKILKSTVK